MKERPILFSAPMVRAILDGQKTMTRRVVHRDIKVPDDSPSYVVYRCPYGQPGERLWVRESARVINVRGGSREIDIEYQADATFKTVRYPERLAPAPKGKLLANGTYREASRIILEITNVRVERLNDISDEDALCEGVREEYVIVGASCAGGMHRELTEYRYFYDGGYEEGYDDAVTAFEALWESINGHGSWDVNPWVWVVEFKRVEDNR